MSMIQVQINEPQPDADYDTNPPEVYKLIESKEWKKAIDRIENYLNEVKTWIVRKEPNGKVRWRIMPIHAAIIFRAPSCVVEALLKSYPEGAECKDDQGMIPLHIAFRNGSDDAVFYELLSCYPEGMDAEDRKGRNPLSMHRPHAGISGEKTSGDVPEDHSGLPKDKKPSGFALYVSLAVKNERKRAISEVKDEANERIMLAEEEFHARADLMKKATADELTAIKEQYIGENTYLKEEFEKARAANDTLLKEYHRKVESSQTLEQKNTVLAIQMNDTTSTNGKEITRLRQDNTDLVRMVTQFKERAEKAEVDAPALRAQIHERAIEKESLEMECKVLRVTVNKAASLNIVLQEKVQPLKERILGLTDQLRAMEAEQDAIIEQAEKQDSEMKNSLRVRERMLDAVNNQVKETLELSENHRIMTVETAIKQKAVIAEQLDHMSSWTESASFARTSNMDIPIDFTPEKIEPAAISSPEQETLNLVKSELNFAESLSPTSVLPKTASI